MWDINTRYKEELSSTCHCIRYTQLAKYGETVKVNKFKHFLQRDVLHAKRLNQWLFCRFVSYFLPSIPKVKIKFWIWRWIKVVKDQTFQYQYIVRLLVGKPEGRRPLGRPRRRWVDNIRIDLGEARWGDVDWIGLAQDRNRWRALVNSVLNFRVPLNAGKLSSGLSSSAQLHRVS
jgi:hypothetical protein